MPDENNVLCGNAACEVLPLRWQGDLLGSAPRPWEERRREECHVCQEHRRRRQRVLRNPEACEDVDRKFADAPLIHPWNAPKYHASLVRARLYARKTQQILLWAVAEDTPTSAEHRSLSSEELDAKRAEWAMYHDQKTSGIMGFLPCVRNMPYRITQTDMANKNIIFENRRCRLYGW